MHPAKVQRDKVRQLTDLPNIGKAMVVDLHLLGITKPEQLRGQDALALYYALCDATAARQDPCVLDTFLSIVDFANGGEPRPWWDYTVERKAMLTRRGIPPNIPL